MKLETKSALCPQYKEFPQNWKSLELQKSQSFTFSASGNNAIGDRVYGWSDDIEEIKIATHELTEVTVWLNSENREWKIPAPSKQIKKITFRVDMFRQYGQTILPHLESFGPFDSLDSAFTFIHSSILVERNSLKNKGWFWDIQTNERGCPEFFSFTPPRNREKGNVIDYKKMEVLYFLPKGQIEAVHIVRNDRQDWIKDYSRPALPKK